MRRYYAGKLTRKQKQKEIFKIQMAIILTCLVVAISLIEAHSYVPDRPLNDVKINNFVNSDDTSISKNIQKPQKTETESTLTVKEQIAKIAEEEDFKYKSYLLRLAACESRFNPKATNNNGVHGVDRGIFQINDRYHSEVSDRCAYNIKCATKWTMWRINSGYQHEWACDEIVKGNYDYLQNFN